MEEKLINKKFYNKLALSFIVNIIVGIGTMIPIVFMQRSIDTLLDHRFNDFLISIGLYIGVYIFVQILRTYVSKRTSFLELGLINSMRVKLVRKILNTRIDLLEKQGGQFIHQRVMEDFSVLEGRIANLLMEFSLSLSSAIVGIIIFAYYDFILLIVLIPISFIATMIVNKTYEKADTYSVELQENKSNLNKEFRYIVVGGRDIILYMRNKYFFKRFDKATEKTIDVEKKNIELQNFSQNIVGISFNIMIGILILVGGFHIKDGTLSIGALVAVIMYNSMVTDPIFNLINNQKEFLAIKNAFKRINKIYGELKPLKDKKLVDLESVRLEDVCLSYEGNKVLDGFNLEIKKGERIKICGKTGSGKSSIAKIITGLYTQTSGRLLVNGEENNVCTMSSVFQNNVLFDDTVENNIKFFRDVSEEKYRKIIEMTHAEDILLKHQDDTIGEDGNKLSGGEKTRVFVARSLVQEADLYIFDEISTGLDEAIFQDMLEKIVEYLEGKTIIFIDHRYMDTKYFDKSIYV